MSAPLVAYTCERCEKPAKAPLDSVLTMLLLCGDCQDERFAAGMRAQRGETTTPPKAAKHTGAR